MARVKRLEQVRAPMSPFELAFGSLDAFATEARNDANADLLDRRDMLGEDGEGGVLRAILGWHSAGIWAR